MTLQTTIPLAEYVENGVTLVHPVPFQFGAASDVACSRIAAGVETMVTLGADYNVTGGGGATGSITKTSAGTPGTIFRIKRRTTRSQPTDYTPGDDFPAETHEAALDRLAAVNQEQDVNIADIESRAVRVPVGESAIVLPPALTRAGKFQAYDVLGEPIAASGTGNDPDLRADLAAPSGYTHIGGTHLVPSITPNGVNDALSIQALFDAGHKTVDAPYANYLISTTVIFPPGGKLRSPEKAVFTKNANIDMFDMSAQGAELENIDVDANGVNFSGRGAFINAGPNSYGQKHTRVDILHSRGPALEFVGADAGQRFVADGCNYSRSDITQAGVLEPAVVDVDGGNRMFTDCGTIDGCPLIELRGMANTGIVNCQGVNIIFSALTSRTRVTGDRIAALGGALVVDGNDNYVGGDIIAGSVQLAVTSQRCTIAPTSLLAGAVITDLSNAVGSNMNFVYDVNGVSFTPVWGQVSGVGPAIGNGTITGRLFRNGRHYNVAISVSLGSTSTLGDGTDDWTFSLPAPNNRTAAFVGVGKATGNHSGTFVSGDAQIAQGASVITVRNPGGATGWKAAVPVPWANTDGFNISIPYEVG